MYSIKLIFMVAALAQITTGVNIASTSPSPSPISSTTEEPTVKGVAANNASTTVNPPSSSTKSPAHVHGAEEDDCSDEVGAAEPEPETSGDRQGKQLTLGDDKDKYSHENGTAEPEPEQTSNDKLTGNNTTKAPAQGSAASITSSVLGICFAVWFTKSTL